MINISLKEGKKLYFASDFHLGIPNYEKSLEREKKIVKWLDSIKLDCQALFLVGDVFDFWFEYKHVVPKGFIRLQGKLAELADSGVKIYMFRGNHDMWLFDYFEKEIGATIFQDPQTIVCNGVKIFIHHGDGLGAHDRLYRFVRKFFTSKLCQWLFARLHPNAAIGFANYNSTNSRLRNSKADEVFLGEKEHLWQFCKNELKKEHYDYFLMGHRHLPLYLPVGETSYYINLGEWVNQCFYGEFSDKKIELKSAEPCGPFFTENDL